MSDRIAVMNEGSIEQIGGVDDLYEDPETRFVAEFLGETNLFEGELLRAGDDYALTDGEFEVTLDPTTLGEEVRHGQSVVYTIRPESLAIDDRTLETDNVWNGVVENAIYKGSFTVYEVDIGGRLLKVQRQRQAGVGRTEEGQSVVVGFDADEGELLVE